MRKTSIDYHKLFVGLEVLVPLMSGKHSKYINLDNSASTPAMVNVQETVQKFLKYYSSVHQGTGFKSQLSTQSYERARQVVKCFVNAEPDSYICIFGKNATEAINKLARRYPFTSQKDVVLVSMLEHHSNDLPWRGVANVVYIPLTADGRLDEVEFDVLLKRYCDQIALISISGASNVTGFINPIHRMAERAHAIGAQIAVDCAQLAPHRRIEMLPLNDPAHLDYVMLSAHKMYAPFGTGALIGRRDTFEQGLPDLTGGGEVECVSIDDVIWSEPPERDEAGSPNTIGAVALGAAISQLEEIGMENVAQHEARITEYALSRLGKIPGFKIYGDTDPERAIERLGVIPFNLDGFSHFLVAAILGYEFGIGVRSGCFCAHPYTRHLLGILKEERIEIRQGILNCDRRNMPGMLRASFGLYNTFEDVDALVEALGRIRRGKYQGEYIQDTASGEFHPEGWDVDYEQYFSFKESVQRVKR